MKTLRIGHRSPMLKINTSFLILLVKRQFFQILIGLLIANWIVVRSFLLFKKKKKRALWRTFSISQIFAHIAYS